MAERLLSGWGRSTWSRATVVAPDSTSDARRLLDSGAPVIARGLGRSYGDQATNAGGTVADMTGVTRIGTPDADGVITVDAGVSLDELLRVVVPQGWFVPVSPGTRYVTVGGAIAADIHGKNHHVDGTFCAHVRELNLLVGDGSVLACGPERDAEVFWATAGGLGLTGVILDATIRLHPIETSRVLVDTTRYEDLDALLGAMVAADETAPLSVAWVDLMASGSPGRSVLTTGRFARATELSGRDARDPLAYDPSQRLAAPPLVPSGLLRTSTVRAFNEAWFRAAPRERRDEIQSIARYFHPLDGVRGWNRIYGRGGFLQWQIALPDGAEPTLAACVDALTASPTPCFLAVLKRFGPANPGPLSFPMQGWTLAADIPAGAVGVGEELDALDRAVADAGGRIYLAKDARMDPALLPVMYPRLDQWRSVRDRVDPDHRFRSDMARRLGL